MTAPAALSALMKLILLPYLVATTGASSASKKHFGSESKPTSLQRMGEERNKRMDCKSVPDEKKGQESRLAQFEIGGGAINEKERLYSRGNLSNNGVSVVSSEPSNVSQELEEEKSVGGRGGSSGYDPRNILSHSLHSLVGLDRYPNYLSRFSMGNIEKLECALEERLYEVRSQKRIIEERREGIARLVQRAVEMEENEQSSNLGNVGCLRDLLTPPRTWEEIREKFLDPRAAKAIFKSKMFSHAVAATSRKKDSSLPSVEEVLSGRVAVELDPAMLEELMEQEMFDVYSFPLLSSEFCGKLRSIVQRVVSLGEKEEFSILNIGRRPVDLDTIGLGWVNDLLFHLVIRPIARLLYQDTESMRELDWRQGYVAGYSVDPSAMTGTPRRRLVSHTDDSEVTLNLCIGDEFEGGALQFRGLRGTDAEGQLVGEFQPQLGTALLHAGRHLHEVTPVISGDRYAYIVWARSWNGVRAQTCPCCWLNRRESGNCICAPRWN